MLKRETIVAASRPSGVVVFAAVGQLLGGVAVLGWAYAYAETLGQGGMGVLLGLIAVGLLGCGLALLPTHVLSLLCGFAFGLYGGFAVAILTVTAAAPLGYVCGGFLAGGGVNQLLRRYPRGAAVCEAITRASSPRAGVLVGLLRLSPVVPYASTNVLAAIFGVPMRPFIAGTFLGLSPRVLMVVAIGAGLENLQARGTQTSPWMLAVGIAATVLAFIAMGVVAKRTLSRMTRQDEPVPQPSLATPRRPAE